MAKTVIHRDFDILFGDEDLLDVAKKRSFVGLVFELLSEHPPTADEEKLFELILNLSIDHGPNTRSAKKVIEKAQGGHTISESVAAGIAEINDVHGGAQEKLMEILYGIKSGDLKIPLLVDEYIKEKKRFPGFGHRLYKEKDPRAELILGTLMELGLPSEFVNLASDLRESIIRALGTLLPINIDGAIAVALCTLGWDSTTGKAVFIIARSPGLCGQYLNVCDLQRKSEG